LKTNNHDSEKLQHAIDKYGIDNFEFVIIERLVDDLLLIEQKYLDFCQLNKENCYNVAFSSSSPMLGRKHNEVTKSLISKRLIGKNSGVKNFFHGKEFRNGGLPPDETQFSFQHINGETFNGTRKEFYTKLGCIQQQVDRIVNGRRKSYKGWSLTHPSTSS